jgi:hypothetical protein
MNYKLKNILAASAVMMIAYSVISFTTGTFNVSEWHWVARAIFGLAGMRVLIALLSKIS